jgi:hypothetical protein
MQLDGVSAVPPMHGDATGRIPDGGRKGGLWGDVPRAVGPSSHRAQDVSVAAEAYQKATSGIIPLTILDYYHNAYAGGAHFLG